MSEVANVPTAIGGAQYAGMIRSAANALLNQKDLINRLNVYPVPDGDTGSNMSMTMKPAGDLNGQTSSLSECADKVASLFLRAARGNSGVILSLFFRGLAKGFKGVTEAGTAEVVAAFEKGVKEAYKAVQYPREGTILTVMRSCTEIETEGLDLLGLFDRMYDAAADMLEKTPDMLPVLKQAGVVDSGGRGFLEILYGMRAYLKGAPVESESKAETKESADFASFDPASIENPYCTECIITKNPEYTKEGSVEKLRKFVLSMGDSVVFAEDSEIVKIHVHTKDPGKVLSEALKFGSLYTVKVENMQNQHSELIENQSAESEKPAAEEVAPAVAEPVEEYGFVAVTMGDGMRSVFEDLGVAGFVSGGQTMNPSTEQLVEAVLQIPAKNVFIFPNNSNICLVAEQVRRFVEDRNVFVIPTKSVPQGISALMQFDPDASAEDNRQTMLEAMKAVKTLDMTYAAHDSTVDGESVTCGQILGLVEHKVRYVADSQAECMEKMLPELEGASYITVFYGSDVSEEEANETLAFLQSKAPDTEIALLSGGQPLYYYVISVE